MTSSVINKNRSYDKFKALLLNKANRRSTSSSEVDFYFLRSANLSRLNCGCIGVCLQIGIRRISIDSSHPFHRHQGIQGGQLYREHPRW